MDAKRVLPLIGDIYDAALDAERWPHALRGLAQFADGCAVGLVTKDATRKEGIVDYHYGSDDRYIGLYRERYWRFDPLGPMLHFPPGRLITTADVMPVDEFEDGPFYQEWARPQGFREAVNLVLDKSSASISLLSLIIGDGSRAAIDETTRRLSHVTSHIRRAVQVASAVGERTGETKAFADTLEHLAVAIFLMRGDGGIIHANAAGRVLLDAEGPLVSVHGRLTARDSRANRSLMAAIAGAEHGGGEAGPGGISLALTANSDRYVAHVLPLTSGARQAAIPTPSAVAAVFVRKVAVGIAAPPEIIAKTYKLTPTELRVLLAIVDVGGGPEVADALGIGQGTVKWHLGSLYQKTGASRQVDLVKLVAGFSSPLLN